MTMIDKPVDFSRAAELRPEVAQRIDDVVDMMTQEELAVVRKELAEMIRRPAKSQGLSSSQQPLRIPELQSAHDELAAVIERVEKAYSALLDRLQPILAAAAEPSRSSNDSKCVEPYTSPAAKRFYELVGRLHRFSRMVEATVERIEV